MISPKDVAFRSYGALFFRILCVYKFHMFVAPNLFPFCLLSNIINNKNNYTVANLNTTERPVLDADYVFLLISGRGCQCCMFSRQFDAEVTSAVENMHWVMFGILFCLSGK